MLCEHGNVAPCVECDIEPLKAENEALRARVAELESQGDADPVGWVSERLLEDMLAGKLCGIGLNDEPCADDSLPLYTCPQPDQHWEPSAAEYDRAIHHNPDAKAWADLFMQTFPSCGADHETMLGWFANAMMAMYDHVHSKKPAQQGVPEEIISAVISLVKDAAAAHLNSEFNSCLSKIRKLLYRTQSEADGWVKCSDRLPTDKEADANGNVWVWLGVPGISEFVDLRSPSMVRELFYNDCATYWKPTGLKRPLPPKQEQPSD